MTTESLFCSHRALQSGCWMADCTN